MKNRFLLLPCLLLLVAAPALAGVVFEVETTDHEQSPPKVESMEMYAEGRNLKMTINPGESGKKDGEAIYRGDRREMVIVDHDEKSYVVVDEEAVGAVTAQVSSAMSQMQEALKNIPEDQRALVEQMMKKRMPPAAEQPDRGPRYELRKTSERAEKAGYPCVKYDVLRNGNKTREMWVTPWNNVEGGEEVQGTFREMADFFSELMDAVEESIGNLGATGGGTFGGLGDNPFTYMKDLDGFPVVVRGFEEDGSLEDESNLRSATRRTLDPADFEPPAGYKRRSMGF